MTAKQAAKKPIPKKEPAPTEVPLTVKYTDADLDKAYLNGYNNGKSMNNENTCTQAVPEYNSAKIETLKVERNNRQAEVQIFQDLIDAIKRFPSIEKWVQMPVPGLNMPTGTYNPPPWAK